MRIYTSREEYFKNISNIVSKKEDHTFFNADSLIKNSPF